MMKTMGQRRSITGSRILITGASQGIGKAVAELAAVRGAKVLVCARKSVYLQSNVAVARISIWLSRYI